MRGYIIGALVSRGVGRSDAKKLVDKEIIQNPINVDTLSGDDIKSLLDLLKAIELEEVTQ